MFIPALICGVIFTSFGSKDEKPKDFEVEIEMFDATKEWWYPILQKLNIELGAYNNFKDVFVMGMEGNSINNGICTLKVATVLIKGEDGSYGLFEADMVNYNIEKRTFDFIPVAKKAYSLDAELNKTSATHGSITRLELLEGGVIMLRGNKSKP